jgi:hypothetical protein|tara:strand:- start:50 stop:313 length:264 start_codon:yes stop_codon:yes gene_type:complete
MLNKLNYIEHWGYVEHVDHNKILGYKTCIFTGKDNVMPLPIRQGQLEAWVDSTILVQDAFPHLNKSQREFIKSGCSPEDWDILFSDE